MPLMFTVLIPVPWLIKHTNLVDKPIEGDGPSNTSKVATAFTTTADVTSVTAATASTAGTKVHLS